MKKNYYDRCHNVHQDIRHNLCHECTCAVEFKDFTICRYDKDVDGLEI